MAAIVAQLPASIEKLLAYRTKAGDKTLHALTQRLPTRRANDMETCWIHVGNASEQCKTRARDAWKRAGKTAKELRVWATGLFVSPPSICREAWKELSFCFWQLFYFIGGVSTGRKFTGRNEDRRQPLVKPEFVLLKLLWLGELCTWRKEMLKPAGFARWAQVSKLERCTLRFVRNRREVKFTKSNTFLPSWVCHVWTTFF